MYCSGESLGHAVPLVVGDRLANGPYLGSIYVDGDASIARFRHRGRETFLEYITFVSGEIQSYALGILGIDKAKDVFKVILTRTGEVIFAGGNLCLTRTTCKEDCYECTKNGVFHVASGPEFDA